MRGIQWKSAKLGDVAAIERESIAPSSIAEGTTFVGLENIDGATGSVSPRKVGVGEIASTKFRFGPQHVLYGKLRPNLRKIARPTDDGVCSTDILPIFPSPELDRDYLFHFLRQPALVGLATMRAPEANLPRLSPRILRTFPIRFPPLPEQQRIAAILDKADAVRRKRQQTLALADQFLRSTFLDLFGDPVTNPKGWPVESFEECCEAIFKGAFDLKAASYRNEGIPFIRIADIQDRTIDLSNAVFIDEETHEKYGRSELTPGDIVFSKVGTIDRIAAIPKTIPRCNCSQNNVGARLKPDLLQVEFALALLTTSAILNQIRAGSKKAVQDKLVLSELRRLSVILPPTENQHRFTSIVEFVERQRAYQRAHLAKLDALFASLQQRAFRGEL